MEGRSLKSEGLSQKLEISPKDHKYEHYCPESELEIEIYAQGCEIIIKLTKSIMPTRIC